MLLKATSASSGSQIAGDAFRTLAEGARVSFVPQSSARVPSATEVTPV
jgi:cold shock CspA family protein